jgi:PBP superfamily domain/MoeA C-terminal region (domain IV)
VVLPGFPTSAIFTFHEFVAPVIRQLAGSGGPRRGKEDKTVESAKLAVKVNSEIGRTEYLLVGLVETMGDNGVRSLSAYPMGQGSGSVTTFSRADGFATIGRHEEIVPAGAVIDVQLLSRDLQLADLVVIGSHCIALDYLLGELERRRVKSKFLAVGSTGGLLAAKREECDLAGVHLLDPLTNQYNRPFLTPALDLIPGYGRLQGIVFRKGDARFEGRTAEDAMAIAVRDPGEWDARPDRSTARRRPRPANPEAARLRVTAAKSQCGRRRRAPGPRRLGDDARYNCTKCGAGISTFSAGAVRLHRASVQSGTAGSGCLPGAARGTIHAGKAGSFGNETVRVWGGQSWPQPPFRRLPG